jgi:hypothetical protein
VSKNRPLFVQRLSVFLLFRELIKIRPPARKKTGRKLWAGPPTVTVAPSPPSRLPTAPSWTGMQRRRPPVRQGECRSRPRPPFKKTGQLRQRRRHGRRDALVSSPAAGIRPSLLGPPPTVGQWRRQHIDADTRPRHLRHRDDDARPSRPSSL